MASLYLRQELIELSALKVFNAIKTKRDVVNELITYWDPYHYLHSSFRQVDLHGEILPSEDVRVVSLSKRIFQLFQLLRVQI